MDIEAANSSWEFFGRVLPERYPVSSKLPKLMMDVVGPSIKVEVDVFYHHSQFVCSISVLSGSADIYTLRNVVEEVTRSQVDLFGYTHGMGFDVEVLSASSRTNDEKYVFGTGLPVLISRRNLPGPITEINGELLSAVGKSLPARLALADFREAIKARNGNGFFCYRAIEAMMQAMKTSSKEDDKVAWLKLRKTLNVRRDALDYVKEHAYFPRHGKAWAITDEEKQKVFTITDELIRRFLQFLINGERDLNTTDFPELTP